MGIVEPGTGIPYFQIDDSVFGIGADKFRFFCIQVRNLVGLGSSLSVEGVYRNGPSTVVGNLGGILLRSGFGDQNRMSIQLCADAFDRE